MYFNAIAARYHSRCVVRWRSGRGNNRVVHVSACRSRQLTDALHLLPHGSTAHGAVGVKLYAYSIRIETVEIDLNFEYMIFLV